jgi:aminoglycoside phosphotransferase (APT) family kinase protein
MFGLDTQQLHHFTADYLDRRVLPLFSDPVELAEAAALVRVLRRTPFGSEVDQAAGRPWPACASLRESLSATRAGLTDCVVRVDAALVPAADPGGASLTTEAMTAHLRTRDPRWRAAGVRHINGGFSKQTVLFDRVGSDGTIEPLVLRRDLADSPAETSVRDEYPVLRDLYQVGLPVPEPLWLDDGSEHVPGPFLVSRRVDGTAIGDPAAGARSDLAYDPTELLATTLARVHAVPLSAMTRSGLCDARWDLGALHGQIRHWETRYRENAPGPVPLLDAAIGWLYENARLGLQPATIVHGDYGFYNMLVRDGELAALVDWEMTHVGSPAWDLAYVRDHVSKLGTYDRFLAAYTAAGGIEPPAGAIDYFQIFTFLRTITMSLVVLEAFNRGRQRRIPIVDVCQIIYPLHLAALAEEFARVARHDGAGAAE